MKTIWLAATILAITVLCRLPAQAEPGSTSALTTAGSLRVLSTADARAYAAAFAAIRRGQDEAAEMALDAISDPCLMGRLSYDKLTRPGYAASYGELRNWLEHFRDQPGADRIHAMARRAQQPGDPELPEPSVPAIGSGAPGGWARVERLAQRYESPEPALHLSRKAEAAREAYFAGRLEQAASLSLDAQDHWISGLTTFRQGRFDEALKAFDLVAHDRSGTEWTRSAGGYWAARAAIASGAAEKAPSYLRLAAATPYTFYGLIAERQLGLDPAVSADGLASGQPGAQEEPPVPLEFGAELARLTGSDERAHRAAALAQIGLKPEAGLEVRSALALASAESERRNWSDLALALNAPLITGAYADQASRHFSLASYATPDFQPKGGYTLDRALVLALVKQESRFNTNARGGGARGLMQITPATAARISGDRSLATRPARLQDPAVNLRLGQDYVARLLTQVKGDLIKAVAAYNAGPGPITRLSSQMPNADSLLMLESVPGGSTRDFVHHVVANYWIYREIFGQPAKSLDAAARAETVIPMLVDQG